MGAFGYEYISACAYCGKRPFSEGPHHSVTCVRYKPDLAIDSALALSGYCRFCGATPFLAGPHHSMSCRRFFVLESVIASLPETGTSDDSVRSDVVPTLEHIVGVFEAAEVPLLTLGEVATELKCSPETVRDGLEWLVDDGTLYRKSTGAYSEVFLLAKRLSDS